MAQVLAWSSGSVEKTIAPVDELWVTAVIGWLFRANQNLGGLIAIGDGLSFVCFDYDAPPANGWNEQCDSGQATTSPQPNQAGYQTIELHWKRSNGPGGASDPYVDGVQLWSDTDFYDTSATFVRIGGVGDSYAFARSVKIGTTRGASDIFSDDFSGDLSAWDVVDGDAHLTEDPFPPVLRDTDPPLWRLIVTDLASETLSLLDGRATDREFVYVLGGPATSTGQVASDDPEINLPAPGPDDPALLSNNTRLLYALRRERNPSSIEPPWICRYGGLVLTVDDQGADTPTTRYTAADPWQLLMARPIRDPFNDGAFPKESGLRFDASTRASDIVKTLLAQTEDIEGETHIDFSDESLLEDTEPLGAAINFEPTLTVGEAWQQLMQTGTIDILLNPIYDPLARPGKVVELQIGPQLGQLRANAVMGWDIGPNSITDISRMVDGTRLADVIEFITGFGVRSLPQFDSDAIAKYGQWWSTQVLTGDEDAELVAMYAVIQLALRRNGARNLSFSPAPEWGLLSLRDYALGDFVPVWASRNLREPIGVDYPSFDPDAPGDSAGFQRVYQIPIGLDDDGTERVRGIVTSQDQTS